jgi:hypothetical protein
VGTLDDSPTRIRRWRAADLAQHAATKRCTVTRSLIPAMVADGVIARRGRSWYGRAVDIDAWLLGRWATQSTATSGTADREVP